MSKRGVGAVFCLIFAILYAARYIAAASYDSATSGPWGKENFNSFLSFVGPPWTIIWLTLLIGVSYLVWAEIVDYKRKVK